MIKHISMFSFKKGEATRGNIDAFKKMLQQMPQKVPSIISSEVMEDIGLVSQSIEIPNVAFCTLIQVITFADVKDASEYPNSSAHIELSVFGDKILKNVASIDLEILD